MEKEGVKECLRKDRTKEPRDKGKCWKGGSKGKVGAKAPRRAMERKD